MVAFDAPTREECAVERNRSNIPQQALVLLNDPTYVEAARNLAARIIQEADGAVEDRLKWVWRQVLVRPPSAEELRAVRQVFEKHHAEYLSVPDQARALVDVGQVDVPEGVALADLAAWTSVARILLNLHETITRS
jgi:hypothetical protein